MLCFGVATLPIPFTADVSDMLKPPSFLTSTQCEYLRNSGTPRKIDSATKTKTSPRINGDAVFSDSDSSFEIDDICTPECSDGVSSSSSATDRNCDSPSLCSRHNNDSTRIVDVTSLTLSDDGRQSPEAPPTPRQALRFSCCTPPRGLGSASPFESSGRRRVESREATPPRGLFSALTNRLRLAVVGSGSAEKVDTGGRRDHANILIPDSPLHRQRGKPTSGGWGDDVVPESDESDAENRYGRRTRGNPSTSEVRDSDPEVTAEISESLENRYEEGEAAYLTSDEDEEDVGLCMSRISTPTSYTPRCAATASSDDESVPVALVYDPPSSRRNLSSLTSTFNTGDELSLSANRSNLSVNRYSLSS